MELASSDCAYSCTQYANAPKWEDIYGNFRKFIWWDQHVLGVRELLVVFAKATFMNINMIINLELE